VLSFTRVVLVHRRQGEDEEKERRAEAAQYDQIGSETEDEYWERQERLLLRSRHFRTRDEDRGGGDEVPDPPPRLQRSSTANAQTTPVCARAASSACLLF
jgi:hypothetical protein